jgi:hypothetical protein
MNKSDDGAGARKPNICPMCQSGNKPHLVQGRLVHETDKSYFRSLCRNSYVAERGEVGSVGQGEPKDFEFSRKYRPLAERLFDNHIGQPAIFKEAAEDYRRKVIEGMLAFAIEVATDAEAQPEAGAVTNGFADDATPKQLAKVGLRKSELQPDSPESRVRKYLVETTGIGVDGDPIEVLIASHAVLSSRVSTAPSVEELELYKIIDADLVYARAHKKSDSWIVTTLTRNIRAALERKQSQ